MKTETLQDILRWTKDFHAQLGAKLEACEQDETAERGKMVLGYLAQHEKDLSKLLKEYSQSASENALNTWCYDYLQNYSIDEETSGDKPLEMLTVTEITAEVERRHNGVIALYKHLLDRVDIPAAVELMQELVNLEEHEAMRMAQSTNRFQDM